MQACYNCVINPWEYYVQELCSQHVNDFVSGHMNMTTSYRQKLRDVIASAAHEAIWKHHKEQQEERCVVLLSRAATAAYQEFLLKRNNLVNTFIAPAIELVISQHFLALTDRKDAPLTLSSEACGYCADDTFFEAFPPYNLREFIVENILPCIDRRRAITDDEKRQGAIFLSQSIIHEWLASTAEERIEMGV